MSAGTACLSPRRAHRKERREKREKERTMRACNSRENW
jgi:hypothetical protein